MNDTNREIESIYERYAHMVHARCRQFLKSNDEAWDATQEVFIKLMKSLHTIDKKESLYSWLLSTSTNHCISQLRRKRGEEFDENFHVGDSDDRAPQEEQLSKKELMRELLDSWDKKTREVVTYIYIYGYKQEEVARMTGMGESTIRKYLTRFRRESSTKGIKLKEALHG